jgi:uncharacterized membrane protein
MLISLSFGLKIILIFKLIKSFIVSFKIQFVWPTRIEKYSIVALKIHFSFVNLFIKLLILKSLPLVPICLRHAWILVSAYLIKFTSFREIIVFLIERFSISRFHNFCIWLLTLFLFWFRAIWKNIKFGFLIDFDMKIKLNGSDRSFLTWNGE